MGSSLISRAARLERELDKSGSELFAVVRVMVIHAGRDQAETRKRLQAASDQVTRWHEEGRSTIYVANFAGVGLDLPHTIREGMRAIEHAPMAERSYQDRAASVDRGPMHTDPLATLNKSPLKRS